MNGGAKGVSGELMFSTGTTTCGGSGSISIGTGTACNGDDIKVGDGNTLDGGHVFLFAGKTVATADSTGGSISIRSGYSLLRSSGTINIRTLNAGTLRCQW